jgi:hypothetical protein
MHLEQTNVTLKCLLIVVVWCTVSVHAQQPGKSKDPTPFARPKFLCTFNTSDVHNAFQKILGIITVQGFKSDGINWSDGELSAWRRDNSASPNQDKILVWLERDLEQPQSKVRLYLLYARYEQFFGTSDLTRVKADSDFESQQVGQLKQKLIDFATNGGVQ